MKAGRTLPRCVAGCRDGYFSLAEEDGSSPPFDASGADIVGGARGSRQRSGSPAIGIA